jgi:hypothetical protein
MVTVGPRPKPNELTVNSVMRAAQGARIGKRRRTPAWAAVILLGVKERPMKLRFLLSDLFHDLLNSLDNQSGLFSLNVMTALLSQNVFGVRQLIHQLFMTV